MNKDRNAKNFITVDLRARRVSTVRENNLNDPAQKYNKPNTKKFKFHIYNIILNSLCCIICRTNKSPQTQQALTKVSKLVYY